MGKFSTVNGRPIELRINSLKDIRTSKIPLAISLLTCLLLYISFHFALLTYVMYVIHVVCAIPMNGNPINVLFVINFARIAYLQGKPTYRRHPQKLSKFTSKYNNKTVFFPNYSNSQIKAATRMFQRLNGLIDPLQGSRNKNC